MSTLIFVMEKSDILDYQAALPESDLNRKWGNIQGIFHAVVDLEEELQMRLIRTLSDGGEVVVVDGGSGYGVAIEELARVMPFFQDGLNFRRRLRAIGIDLNPLPQNIPRRILEINPDDGCFADGKIFDCVADHREDDLERLETLEDESVDIFYSASGFNAVVDVLRALENVWRVLKPGGIGVIVGPHMYMSDPDIRDIIAKTPGASRIFVLNTQEDSWPAIRRDFIRIKKPHGVKFGGFPFRLKEAKPLFTHGKPAEAFIKVGIYERAA